MLRNTLSVTPLGSSDRREVSQILTQFWASPRIVSRGVVHQADELPGFIIKSEGRIVGLITYNIKDEECEIVSLNSLGENRGIGSALVEAVVHLAKEQDCRRVWLITTNDNLNALKFYQKRGFQLAALHRGGITESRRIKPEISLIGENGIPLRDEIELEIECSLVPEPIKSLRRSYPILEYDPYPHGIIDPEQVYSRLDMPEECILCFFKEVMQELEQAGKLIPIFNVKSEIGLIPVYKAETDYGMVSLVHPGIGAPFSAGMLEEIIARGGRRFVVIGSAGILDSSIPCGKLIIPVSAVRDEGTSYHYLPPHREVSPSMTMTTALEKVLKRRGLEYLKGKTWTTDAFFRETPNKIKLRRREGCLAVEMEAAAFFAVAQFRSVDLTQLLYAGDDVGGEVWDSRKWSQRTETRRLMFDIAAEVCKEES